MAGTPVLQNRSPRKSLILTPNHLHTLKLAFVNLPLPYHIIDVPVPAPRFPQVVSDQIRLWEASLNRMRADLSVLYENMESRELYERAVQHSRTAGTLLWEDGTKMRFAALEAGA